MSYNKGDKVIYRGDVHIVKSAHVDYHTGKSEYVVENILNGSVSLVVAAQLTPYFCVTPAGGFSYQGADWTIKVYNDVIGVMDDDKMVVLPTGNKRKCECGAWSTTWPDAHSFWCPEFKK